MSPNLIARRCLSQLPNALTLGNALAGLAAVVLFYTQPGEDGPPTLTLAFALMAVAVACDTLDGPLARLLKANNPMGAQLDSLGDAVSFGFAAAAILAGSFWQLSPSFALPAARLWLAAALIRLARFNLETDTGQAHLYFRGMCSPVAALYLLSLLVCARQWPALIPLAAAMSLVLPLLMLSRLRFADLPKHYLSGRRPPWDLLAAALALLVVESGLVVALYFSFFLAQTLLANRRPLPEQGLSGQ